VNSGEVLKHDRRCTWANSVVGGGGAERDIDVLLHGTWIQLFLDVDRLID
jgi:hypothetical protein